MITLAEWNRRAAFSYETGNVPIPNAIQCPECHSEMLDSSPRILTSDTPPRKAVHCPNCGLIDWRVV